MPVHAEIVGAVSEALTHKIDSRWLMAYAAGLGDLNPRYMDTEAHSVVAHPVFPVCLEWAVQLTLGNLKGVPLPTAEEAARGVHGSHDLHLFRQIKAGTTLSTQSTYIDLKDTRAGAVTTMRLDTRDQETNELMATTYQSGVYRGVATAGGNKNIEPLPALPNWHLPETPDSTAIYIAEGAAHVYTECARIWNPIHSDKAYARAAGLPDIILHGTASLALSITEVVNRYADGDPARVKRLGGRFASMVFMPSTVTLESHREAGIVSFQLKTETGDIAIRNGFVCLES